MGSSIDPHSTLERNSDSPRIPQQLTLLDISPADRLSVRDNAPSLDWSHCNREVIVGSYKASSEPFSLGLRDRRIQRRPTPYRLPHTNRSERTAPELPDDPSEPRLGCSSEHQQRFLNSEVVSIVDSNHSNYTVESTCLPPMRLELADPVLGRSLPPITDGLHVISNNNLSLDLATQPQTSRVSDNPADAQLVTRAYIQPLITTIPPLTPLPSLMLNTPNVCPMHRVVKPSLKNLLNPAANSPGPSDATEYLVESLRARRSPVNTQEHYRARETEAVQNLVALDSSDSQPFYERGEGGSRTNHTNTGLLSGAHEIIINNSTLVNHTMHPSSSSLAVHSEVIRWMEPEIMEGAEFDSSERAPPPRCHPGTRTSIIERLNGWVMNPKREKRLLWLQGPAGVGKSAIIQTLVEALSKGSGRLGATLFFSRPNGRSNPQQVIPTIASQLALLDDSYKSYIHELSLRKPRALRTAMQEQFNLLITEPFVRRRLCSGSADILIAIDGLDECDGDPNHDPTFLHRGRSLEAIHRQIVQLISDFVGRYPNVPIIWAIASRPEDHIKSAFTADGIQGTFLEVEIPIDSDEACRDVENYLVASFTEIRTQYPNQFRESTAWPSHVHFLQIAKAALGLFIFAEVVIRFVGDERVGNPISQLSHVLSALAKIQQSQQPRNPLEVLDAIYTTIMERVPNDMITNTKRLLEILIFFQRQKKNISDFTFRDMCEYLMIPHEDAVSALRHLHSVVFFGRGKVENGRPRFFHASFPDFLENPARSNGFYVNEWKIDTHRLVEVLTPRSLDGATQKGAHRMLVQVLQMESLPSFPKVSVQLLGTRCSLSPHQLQSIFEYFDLSDLLTTEGGIKVASELPIRDENGSWADELRRRGCFSVARLDSLSKPPPKLYRIVPGWVRDRKYVAHDYMNSSLHSWWTSTKVTDWSAQLARLYAEQPETKVLIWGHQNGKQCAVILRNDLPDWWMDGYLSRPGEVYISGFSRLK
ncbi:hypothetical protein NP233_g4539 [Leucocoprinus birnbaumii]|uniref:NACHT domain-containing protein n=1 Tax=Leucocoprinus birnbaumii TaxID=56174 RepID=A0AAD5YXI4_9AGAR|nr:hypothetical protein NP233_g4539 [Leucocoprinus birnbaumii]